MMSPDFFRDSVIRPARFFLESFQELNLIVRFHIALLTVYIIVYILFVKRFMLTFYLGVLR